MEERRESVVESLASEDSRRPELASAATELDSDHG